MNKTNNIVLFGGIQHCMLPSSSYQLSWSTSATSDWYETSQKIWCYNDDS